MRRYSCFIALLSLVVMHSCTRNTIDGTYLIYDIESSSERFIMPEGRLNDTISRYLESKLRNKKYAIKEQKDYLILTDIEEKEDIVLTTKVDFNHIKYYNTSVPKGNQRIEINLQIDTVKTGNLIMICDLFVPIEQSIIPVQLGEILSARHRYGRAICYLSKVPSK